MGISTTRIAVGIPAAISIVLFPAQATAQTAASTAFSDGFIATSDRCAAKGATIGDNVVDRYTRLEFSTDETVPIGTDYQSELRHPISRFFSGKSVTRALTLVATYSRHKIDATTTVVSFSHKSGRKGYEWISEVSNQRLITPYFRIDKDGVVKTNWKLALNKTYDSRALQDLLDVVKRATKLIAPTSGLLTSLNADKFKDTSHFVDRSVSSFLKESVDEIAPDEYPLAACAGKDLITLKLVLPQGANVVRNNWRENNIGAWTVRLAHPIHSIFAPGEELTPADVTTRIGSGSVFDYQIAEELSLGQFLGGDSAVTAVKDEFDADGNDADVTAAKLCSLIVGKVQGIGLNRFDTAVTVLAFADQMLSIEDHRTALRNENNCSILRETS